MTTDSGTARVPVAFISHHSSQVEAARHLVRVLARHGIKGWMAPDDIEPGKSFDQVIIEQIGKSDVILLLFCSRSDQSKHVKREIMLAENHNKLIYPIRLETIQPEGLAYWLQDYQWVDWLDQRDDAIERMVRTIRSQLSLPEQAATAEPAAPPAPPPAPPAPAAVPLQSATPLAPAQPAVGGSTGLSRNSKLVLAGVGGLLLFGLAGVYALGPMAGSSDDPVNPDPPVGPGNDKPGGDTGGSGGGGVATGGAILPGMWSATATADNGTVSSDSNCITADEIADPARLLFEFDDIDQFGECHVNQAVTEGGTLYGEMNCFESGSQIATRINVGGTYQPETLEMTYSFNLTGPQGQSASSLQIYAQRRGTC
ncbi:MAG: toll/interleukin-1 receptor domain-containing protein [Erythrobacter sp.]|nr:toll/interleukin-1 receptor domain-containing protein [Erythrobacter sp.]